MHRVHAAMVVADSGAILPSLLLLPSLSQPWKTHAQIMEKPRGDSDMLGSFSVRRGSRRRRRHPTQRQ